MTFGERLRERMDAAGVSQSELARRVGVKQPSIYALLNGNKTGTTHLHKIARELGTTPAYLAGETDDPAEGAMPAPRADDIAEQLEAVMIPEVQVSFSMGGGTVVEDWPVVRHVPISLDWLRGFTTSSPEHLAVTRGDGDSMFPTILDQDLVLLDLSDKTPKKQDRIYAMSYGGLGMIKRLRAMPDGSFEIHSDNPQIRPMLAVDDELHVVGRVIAVLRRI